SAHRRLDFPQPDYDRWMRFVVVEKGADGAPAVRTLDVSQPLSAAFARNGQSTTGSEVEHASA
ncbi:MAG: hypothetical protein KDJ77_17310, partial [Rhodobiaceae bacterium]|nr:hypothetical protein [Rhodobiaceae bacterium]